MCLFYGLIQRSDHGQFNLCIEIVAVEMYFETPQGEYSYLKATYFIPKVSGVALPLVLNSWMSQVKEEWEDIPSTNQKQSQPKGFRKRGRPRKLRVVPPLISESSSPTPQEADDIKEDGWSPFSPSYLSDEEGADDPLAEPVEIKHSLDLSTDVKIEKTDPPDKFKGSLSNLKKKPFKCSQCSKSFKAVITLKRHMKIHSGDLLYCRECSRGFVSKYALKCHERIHTGNLFTCDLCKKGFTTAELLKVHTRRHLDEKPFACNSCPMKFPSASNLKQHKEIHGAEKKYLCSSCGASFNQRRSYDAHILIHGEKKHVCQVCGSKFVRRYDFVEHMRVHTAEKPYRCETCNKSFSQGGTLRRHQRVHQVMQTCHHCGKTLKTSADFLAHLEIHRDVDS